MWYRYHFNPVIISSCGSFMAATVALPLSLYHLGYVAAAILLVVLLSVHCYILTIRYCHRFAVAPSLLCYQYGIDLISLVLPLSCCDHLVAVIVLVLLSPIAAIYRCL